MIRRSASYGLGFTALFLSVVAILTGSSALFYMGTAVIAWILGARLQAIHSVKNLSIDRIMPDHAMVGEAVTVEWLVHCSSKFRHPLVSLIDTLPRRINAEEVSPSLPVAPNIRQPVRSYYRFRPGRRGVFQWSGVTAVGIDAVGISLVVKSYKTSVARLEVWPRPIPLEVCLPRQVGNGHFEDGLGRELGGQEPRSIRNYAPGDSVRHIHWRSTAKRGEMLVKEFESGSSLQASILIQRDIISSIDEEAENNLDLACGKAVFLADQLRLRGLALSFPQFELEDQVDRVDRKTQIYKLLTPVSLDPEAKLTSDLRSAIAHEGVQTFYIFLIARDDDIVTEIRRACSIGCEVIIYFLFDDGAEASSMKNNYALDLELAGARIFPNDVDLISLRSQVVLGTDLIKKQKI